MKAPIRTARDALLEAGLLPPAVPGVIEESGDLLPVILDVWRAHGRAMGRAGSRADRWMQWLQCQHGQGACLTLGDPGCQRPLESWLGPRLAWWPRGVPSGRRVGLASSRLGRKLEQRPEWFAALRAACGGLDRRQDLLLTARSTTTGRFVQRCGSLFGLPVLQIEAADDGPQGLDRWFGHLQTRQLGNPNGLLHTVFLSPPLAGGQNSQQQQQQQQAQQQAQQQEPVWQTIGDVPSRDRALVALSDKLLVLHLRRGGYFHRLLRARLLDPAWPPASVYVALGRELVPGPLADELLGWGAVGWVMLSSLVASQPAAAPVDCGLECMAAGVPGRCVSSRSAPPVVPLPAAETWSFLTHCTRRHDGAWPGQAAEDYLDDLILARPEADHSALAALMRIIGQQRIRASSAGIRGGTPVVSFTAVPLAQLPALHVFRPHRNRWDFEPYGICIRRQWLQQQGARPVCYGDQRLWEGLAPDERPFFQLGQTRPQRGRKSIQWTVEQEWRHLGDVPLHRLPADAALLFVPTLDQARRLAPLSRWPIAVLDEQQFPANSVLT